MSSEFLDIVQQRGYVHQLSDAQGLADKLKSGMQSAYIGFDCTAPSLHAGSLVQIMLLRWWQKCGHKPIVLIGGGTTRVGDPSGKDAARQLLDDAGIARNIEGIASVFSKFITFGNTGNEATLINNAEWLNTLNYIDFLRDVGRHFSVNRMLTMDSVKLRLEREQPLSFLEFNYMCLQAYDFVELYNRTGCILQMGGSDQWGNIVSGIDLGRRMAQAELYALTSPLLTNANGAKMGKTADGAVWLSADMLSPYDYWQYWRNTLDADVVKFLKLFTELSLDEIARLGALQGSEINEAKKILATEATALLHGREAATLAEQTAKTTFELGAVSADLPTVEVSQSEIDSGFGVLVAFTKADLVPSTSEARRQIKGGGLKLNDVTLSDERGVISHSDFIDGVAKLSMGKKKHVLLKIVA